MNTRQWRPLGEAALWDLINDGMAEFSASESRFYEAIRVQPEKWCLEPWSQAGGGFWVVGVIGRTVLWYNDIEDGFNSSAYEKYGFIRDYWCDQDEFALSVRKLKDFVEGGFQASKCGPPCAVKVLMDVG